MSQYPPPQGYPAPQGYPQVPQGYPAPAPYGAAAPGQPQAGWTQPAAAPAPGYGHQQQQYQQASPPVMQPQQHQPAAVQPRVVVVSPRYCLPQQVTLIMQESISGTRNDDFHIADPSGRTYFMLKASAFSVGGQRMLFDAHGQPCIGMEQKMLTLHGTWIMRRPGDGVKVAEVKPSMASMSPTIKVYMNDGDKEADYIIKGDIRAKSFSFTEVRSGSVIATVKKESKYANANAFLMSKLTSAQKYFLTIEPGVDAAFVTALATLCDEIFHDQPH